VAGVFPQSNVGLEVNLSLSLGDFPWGRPNREICTLAEKQHTGDAPSNQPKVAGVFPQRNVGLEVNLSLSHAARKSPSFFPLLPFASPIGDTV